MSFAPLKQPWTPPSDSLELIDGIWQAKMISPVSYPADGNEACFEVEERSYWFEHRNKCIVELLRKFPPPGTLYDIGGGNGYVALALQEAGIDVVVVEPGPGALNASRRGLRKVIRATLDDADFHPHSLPAVALFDVLEHIQDDILFLSKVHALISPGGRLYCSVPACPILWSGADVSAGHFRRYTVRMLRQAFLAGGFIVEFITHLFAWLVLPVFFARALPFRLLGGRSQSPSGLSRCRKGQHHLPRALGSIVRCAQTWEFVRIRSRRGLWFGTSLLTAASPMSTARCKLGLP